MKASELLHVSPQTLSGQLSTLEEYMGRPLFDRIGKRLVLNDLGKVVYSYADDIFRLGDELRHVLQNQNIGQRFTFAVGVVDVIPKILAFDLLSPAFDEEEKLHLLCHEGDFDSLMAELAINKIDIVISDRPLAPGSAVKAYNHFLGESGLTFYASKRSAKRLQREFPQSLDGEAFLVTGEKSSQKINLMSWFDSIDISPLIVAEFDDSALMKFFGQSGSGVFCTPTTIEAHVLKQYGVSVIGRTEDITERFYAISPERKLKHPLVSKVMKTAQSLFFES